MKKLLGIIFLSLLLSGNSSSASKQAYFCEDTMSVHRYAADWCGKRLGMEEFVYRRLTSENIHN